MAQPLRELRGPNLPGGVGPETTSFPAAGKGYTVDDAGRVPIKEATGQTVSMEIIAITKDLASLNAHTGTSHTFTSNRVKAGDYVVWLGPTVLSPSAATGRGYVWSIENPVTTAGQISATLYNADTSAADKADTSWRFLLIHNATFNT